jgi:hypothetical protein
MMGALPVVVTALVDLEARSAEPTSRPRSVDEYVRLASATLAIRLPMVIFAEPMMIATFVAVRRRLVPDLATVVAPYEVHPEWHHDVARLERWLDATRPLCASNHAKDTPEYLAFGWSKPSCLRRAASLIEGPWYWWVDIGISHVAAVPPDLAERLVEFSTGDDEQVTGPLANSSAGSCLMSLERNDWHNVPANWARTWRGAAASSREWWLQGAQLVAGGLIGVRASELDSVVTAMRDAVIDAAEHGAAATEEMLISRMVVERPSQYRLVPARYDDLFGPLCSAQRRRLHELCPSTRCVRLPGSGRSDRAAFNPSIAAAPEGGFRMIVRHANYHYEAGCYSSLDGSSTIITDNVMMQLDDELRVEWTAPIDDSHARVVPPLFPVHGLEDMRLFHHNGRWWASATSREHRSDGLCEIVVVGFGDADEAATVTTSRRLTSPRPGRHEKNWVPVVIEPIEPGASMTLLWSTDPASPLVVDEVLDVVVLDQALPVCIDDSEARGGSQVVAVAGGWLTVVHRAVADGSRRVYEHRFIWFGSEFDVRARSPWFVFAVEGIEFCAGLAAVDERVVLSFGFEDREAWLATISWDDLRRIMVDASVEVRAGRDVGAI